MIKFKNAGVGINDMDKKKSVVVGYASRFGNIDSHGDIVEKGAFKRTIDHNAKRVKTLMHHDPVQIVGRPIKMYEDEKGLYTETKVSDTAMGRDLLTLIEDGVMDEMSIGFIPVREDYDDDRKANVLREVKLVEYSFVSLASNDQARVEGMKGTAALGGIAASMKRFEKALRDGRFESDEIPEVIDFIVKYWRNVLESSDKEVVNNTNVVESNSDDSPSQGTRPADADSVVATHDGVLEVLKGWQQEYEILSAIRMLGGNQKGK